jgi:hypothetical protein
MCQSIFNPEEPMNIPEKLRKIVRQICKDNPESINHQIKKSIAAIRELPEFAEYVETLVNDNIQEMVYEERHSVTRARGAAYSMPAPSKLAGQKHATANKMVSAAFSGCYGHYMAGTTLGIITGDMIPLLIATEEAKAATHTGYANLLRWCQDKGVVGKLRVRDVIKENDLKKNYDRILAEARRQEPAA